MALVGVIAVAVTSCVPGQTGPQPAAVLAILEVNVDAFSDCSGSSLYTIVNTDSLGPPH